MDKKNNLKMEKNLLLLLKSEKLARIALEDTVQNLREQLISKDKMYAEASKEIDRRLIEKYETKLQLVLQDLRDQYEKQVRANYNDVEALFNAKIIKLENSVRHNEADAAIEESLETQSRIESLTSKIGQLEVINSLLSERIRDLEALVVSERLRICDSEALLDAERKLQLQEYNDLKNTKLSLDLKFAKFSSNDEQPLNVIPTSRVSTDSEPISNVPGIRLTRKRTNVEASKKPNSYGLIVTALAKGDVKILETVSNNKFIKLEDTCGMVAIRCWDIVRYNDAVTKSMDGNVEISEVNAEAKFIKLHNKCDKTINIGGWQIVNMTSADKTQFIFRHLTKLHGNSVITIWSDDGAKKNKSSVNIVMSKKKWYVDDNMKTQLLNNDNVIVHTRVVAKFI